MNDTYQKTKRVLIFCDYYLPGFRAGGPIISISKIVEMLAPNYEVFIITRNKDYGSKAQYEGIKPDAWYKTEGISLFYCKNSLTFNSVISDIFYNRIFNNIYRQYLIFIINTYIFKIICLIKFF